MASLNLCTDELLLLLAAPEQIVSVTHLAQEPAETPLWAAARRHARNDGSLLSVAALRPDLVRDDGRRRARSGTDRRAARHRTCSICPSRRASTMSATSIRRLAAALGRQERGEFVLRGLAALRASAPRARRDTIWLGGGGRTVTAGGLEAQWMALAGLGQRAMQGDRVEPGDIDRPPARRAAAQRLSTGPIFVGPALAGASGRLSRPRRADDRHRRPAVDLHGPLLIGEVLRLRRELAR